MKNILIAFLLTLSTSTAFAQKKYENKAFKFSIQFPENWIEDNSGGIPRDKIFSEKEINETLLKEHTIYLTCFYKSTFISFDNINPKIQFNIIKKEERNFVDFKKKCIESAEELKPYLENSQFLVAPEEIIISGIKSMYFSLKYTMQIKGKAVKLRHRTYAIPYNNYLLHVSMVDEEDGSNCSQEFDEIIKTLQIL